MTVPSGEGSARRRELRGPELDALADRDGLVERDLGFGALALCGERAPEDGERTPALGILGATGPLERGDRVGRELDRGRGVLLAERELGSRGEGGGERGRVGGGLAREQRIEGGARIGELALAGEGIGAIGGDDLVIRGALARHQLGEGERAVEHRARCRGLADIGEEHGVVIERGDEDRALRAEQRFAERERFFERRARLREVPHEVVADREVR